MAVLFRNDLDKLLKQFENRNVNKNAASNNQQQQQQPAASAAVSDDDDDDVGLNFRGSGGNNDDDDDDGGKDNPVLLSQLLELQSIDDLRNRDRLERETPRQLFEEDAYTRKPSMLNPIVDESMGGYDQLGTSSLRQFLDTKDMLMINMSVDRLRANQQSEFNRNNRTLRDNVYSFMSKRDDTLQHNQFDETYNLRNADDESATVGESLLFNNDLVWDDKIVQTTLAGDDLLDQATGGGGDYGDGPPPPPSGGGILSNNQRQQQQQQTSSYSGGGGFSDDEEGRFDFSTATTNNDDNDGGSGGVGLGVSFRTDDGYRHALEFMQNNGYDEETINDFLLLDNVDYNEFRDMNVNEKVQSIKIKLELDSAHRQRADQRINGSAENLLSRQYAVNNKLDDITRLTTELNTTTPIQPPITIREPTSTDPGEEDDPYRSVLIFDDSDDDGGDDDDAAGAISTSTLPIVSNEEPKLPLVTLEEEEAYQCNYERELNRFSGNVLLLKDNVAAVSEFLRKAIKESPIEVARERERQQKQAELQQKLSAQFSPNAVSGRDAVDSHRAPEPQSRNNESAETSRYERQQVDSIDDVEQRLARNTDTGTIYGKTSMQLVVENSISRIQEEQTETMGGMLGATTGVRTIGNSITSNDYLDMCGVPTINDFQRLLDEQQRQHNTNLVDNTKLVFLSNEPTPNISQAPLGILPVNNHNRIIGAKPNMNDDEQVSNRRHGGGREPVDHQRKEHTGEDACGRRKRDGTGEPQR